jgi:diadenylate cyclase
LNNLLVNLNQLVSAARVNDWINTAKIGLELIIIGYAIIWTWGRIRGTQAERLVKGIAVLLSACLLSWLLGLTLITSFLQQLIPVAVVSIVIIFQPEIRRGLGYLGRTTFKVDFSLTDTHKQKAREVVQQLIVAVRELARSRTGALIVIEPPEGERDYLSPGTTINGEVSANLLLSIFEQKSPLHDGAVVIRADKIVAAGVILPITENQKLSLKYGTRHRAAIGLSEIYDGLCIVVSEETGAISAANRGMLVRYNTADDLGDALSYFYEESPAEQKSATPFQAFLTLFGGSKTATVGGASPARTTPATSFQPVPPAEEEDDEEPLPSVLEDVRHPTDVV